MNSTRIQDIKEESARVVVQYGNGYWNARMHGLSSEEKIFDDMCRVHYLWSIIDNSFLSGTDVYVGDTVIADNDFETVYSKIQHYNGIHQNIDLSIYVEIVPDDGDGGSTSPDLPISSDHYRAGGLTVVAGGNAVTFIKDGVASPLSSADYILDAYVISSTGQKQDNLVITTRTAGGFVASDVLKAGTLYYTARLTT